MKKIIRIALLAVLTLSVVSSCKKEGTIHADLSALDRDAVINTTLDNWLDANYLLPYNIQVKYRWDPYEADLDKDLTPPKEALVQPAMETVRDTWIRPYEVAGGKYFMVYNTPKQFYLVGSPSYNGDGTITLGTAEGGKKIVLYVINNFSKSNAANTQEMLHVIHHEYTHILNQKYPYDQAFALVTQSDYTANWNIPTLATARSLGFITQYSRSNPIEDFAEMTSIMLTQGKTKYDAIVNALATDPQTKLRKKEQFVVNYFKSAWNIDFYALQAEVSAAFDRNVPALNTQLGTGKTYTSTTAVSPLTANALTPQSTEFLALWNAARVGTSYTITTFQFLFGANGLVTLRYTLVANGTTTPVYSGDIDFTLTTDASGLSKFTLVNPQPTGATYSNYGVVRTQVTGIQNYLTNNLFRIDYAPTNILGTKGLPGAIIAFYKSTDPTSYIIGTAN